MSTDNKIEHRWWSAERYLPDGRTLYVYPLTYGRARLGVSPPGNTQVFDDEW